MENKVFILDGGMGTMLQAAGLQPGEHPEKFGYEHPEIVCDIHKNILLQEAILSIPIPLVPIRTRLRAVVLIRRPQ